MAKVEFDTRNYWESRLNHKFDLTGVGYRRKSVAFNRWVYRVRTELLDQLFRQGRWTTEDKSILDVGCGTGYFIDYWLTRGAGRVTGIDITEISIGRLKELYPPAVFIHGDLSDPQLRIDEQFDYVSIFDVLFHIIDDDRFKTVAVNLARICKPGARVFITDLFAQMTFSRVKHCRNRSLSAYQDVFSKNGFEVRSMTPLFYTLLPPSGFKNPILRWGGILAWEAVTFITRWNFFGHLVGRALYKLDSVLRKIFKKGPAGYIVVFEYTRQN